MILKWYIWHLLDNKIIVEQRKGHLLTQWRVYSTQEYISSCFLGEYARVSDYRIPRRNPVNKTITLLSVELCVKPLMFVFIIQQVEGW